MENITKKIADILHVLSETSAFHANDVNTAIIAAAGSGRRAGGDVPKQLATVGGLPVIVRTVKAFEACECIHHIVIVGRECDLPMYREYVKWYGFKKIHAIIAGGDTRTESVFRGFEAIPEKTDYVLIHDGARCLVTPDMIESTLKCAHRYKAACAACRAKDTPKISENGRTITETPDRSTLWLAQTPQVFHADLYRLASYTAREDGFEATDDCMLVERHGFEVGIVDCGYQNMKITTAEDFGIAEAILAYRERQNNV